MEKIMIFKLLKRRPFLILVLLLLAFGVQSRAVAQITYAAVHGTVTDTSGALVSNATVTAFNTSTRIKRTANTDSHGYYIVPQLQIGGPYTITINATGFEQFQSSGLTLHLNDNRQIDAQLQIGASAQTVQVQAAAVQVETSDTQLKQVMTAQQIVAIPLLGRNAAGLQKLQPGSVESNDRFGNFAANGNQTQSNAFLLDGADIADATLQTGPIAINPDALAEENIVTSTFNAEFARNSGAIINQSIKSGTNAYHGNVFWFYRDTFLNNGSYFSQVRPDYHQNLYGATLGGPAIKDRLFFFLGYQGFRRRTGSTTLAPVFSPDQVAGNFSVNSTKPLPFPVNGCAAGTPWSSCFQNGQIHLDKSSYNPVALRLINSFVPSANETINGQSYYNFNGANTGASDQGVIRLDYHISENDSLWGSSVFQSSPDTQALSTFGSDLPGFGQTDAHHFKLFMASWTHTFNAGTLNELRAAYFRFNNAQGTPTEVVDPATFGFNITPQNSLSSIPFISVRGLNGANGFSGAFLGFGFTGPSPRKDTNLTAADNLTKIVGNHSLKFGVSVEQFKLDNPLFLQNNGSYSFNGNGTYSSGNPVLDFVLGIPDQYSQSSGGVVDLSSYEFYAYAQDNWKVTNNLTLNYGLAWDTETPWRNNQFQGLGIACWTPGNETSGVYPGGPPGLTYDGDPGCNRAGGPTTKWSHFVPRVGFAWSPGSGPSKIIGAPGSHAFVVRGGFGIYYNRDSGDGDGQSLTNPPSLLQSFGANDTGGSPGFANPFADVTGNPAVSESNRFPYMRPSAGSRIDWSQFTGLNMSTLAKKYSVPYVYNFNLNIQRSLPSNMVAQLGYVGSIGRRLIRAYEGDKITAAGHAACAADPVCQQDANQHIDFPQYFIQPAVSPSGIPWYSSVGSINTDGVSSYHSLQASLLKGPTHGLSFTLAYTYSHALDNGSGLESTSLNALGVNTFPGFEYLSYGDSDYDARHRFVASYDYEIPLFASLNSNQIVKEALGGWHLAGVTALQTGFPVTISDIGQFNSLYCDQRSFYLCPDVPNVSTFHIKSLDPRQPGSRWFDGSMFSDEPIGTFGNAKRNFFHGPGFNYTNLNLAKNFPLGADSNRFIQVRLEAFNAFNHANFSNPDGNFTDGPGQFGVIRSVIGSGTADVNGDPQPGRAVQLAAKFFF
jgi:Carboxypeptidase regulatory-like domain